MTKPDFVYETYIRTTPERIWAAITTTEFTRRYFHQMTVESGWQVGDPMRFVYPDGRNCVEGEIIEADPPHKLVYSWRFVFDPELASEPASRVSYEIEQLGETCRLRVTHDQFPAGSKVLPNISKGWPPILCSLKSLLETGEPLTVTEREDEAA